MDSYARQHDDAIWITLLRLLGETEGTIPTGQLAQARAVATLPGRLGGLGLQCAVASAPAAYWAAWADALPLMHHRHPALTGRIVAALSEPSPTQASLVALRQAADLLASEGFQ